MQFNTSEEGTHTDTRGIQELMRFVNTLCSAQKKLTTLDIAANRIKRIENISHLTELQEFWVSKSHLDIISCSFSDLGCIILAALTVPNTQHSEFINI